MSGINLDTVCVPLRPYKNHANDVLPGGPAGQPIVLMSLRLRR